VSGRQLAGPRRRRPIQRRAQQTIDAILDGTVKVLKRAGGGGITTNRIAAAAGVSVGSLYQYFPDKRAIFAALHDRHVEQASRRIEAALVAHADAPLDGLVRALMEALMEAHASDPELYALLDRELPQGGAAARMLHERLRGALRLALAARPAKPGRDLEATLFVVAHMLDALAHGAILNRPPHLSLRAAREEALMAVTHYLQT